MKDVQLDVLKKLMASMGERTAGRLPKKTGSAVLEISLRDELENKDEDGDSPDLPGDAEFDEEGLDPRLAAIMKKKKAGAPC